MFVGQVVVTFSIQWSNVECHATCVFKHVILALEKYTQEISISIISLFLNNLLDIIIAKAVNFINCLIKSLFILVMLVPGFPLLFLGLLNTCCYL